jgi:hypothetical protein
VVQIRSYPFDPENPPPDISGQWVGTYASAVAGKKFAGTYRSVMTLPQGASDFTGYAILDENTPSELTFPLVGTINGEGVFVRVGQNEKAKLCVTGRLIPPADDAATARIEATYVLKFFSGGFEDSGTLEQEVTPIPVVPDEPPEDDPIP